MEVSDFCYYIVPVDLGVFGLGMTIFLRKSMSNEPGRSLITKYYLRTMCTI